VTVIVDTSVWSLMLRRRPPDLDRTERRAVEELRDLIRDNRAVMLGAIRQEVLSGIRDRATFERLREYLRAFPDAAEVVDDRETAGSYFNALRRRGVDASHVDMFVCAMAVRLGAEVYALDADFERYAAELSVRLHRIAGST
jgi:hypothetical protein